MRPARALAWIAAALLGIGFITLGVLRSGFVPASAGSRAPDYAAVTLDGDSVSLASLRGRVVVLNAWATWCRPCVIEMPSLERLHERFADRGLAVVGVSVDLPGLGADPLAKVRAFVDELDITFTILHDGSGTMQERFAFNQLPLTFIIDRDGRIVERVLGIKEWDQGEYAAKIEALLED